MLTGPLLALTLALASQVANAGLFPPDSVVKMLDPKGFRKVMKQNQTSMVAFVAPWCGHCQRMGPEYSKAALGLHPLIPTYAVDCDNEANKRLCAEQGVKGFPTVKLFPRGKELGSMLYEGERTASGFFYWASRRVPATVEKFYKVEEIQGWIEKTTESDKPRALLLTKDKKVPLLWKVLGNLYKDQIVFASHRDRKGETSEKLGFGKTEGKKESKVIVYPIGATQGVRYEGINKLDSLKKFFDSVLDGTAEILLQANNNAAQEVFEYEPSEEELEIERKQEAQRIALAHGGFADFIDFEEALKQGGKNFHDGGMTGEIPYKKKAEGEKVVADDAAAEKAEASSKAAEPEPEPAVETEPAAAPVEEATPEPATEDDVPETFTDPESVTEDESSETFDVDDIVEEVKAEQASEPSGECSAPESGATECSAPEPEVETPEKEAEPETPVKAAEPEPELEPEAKEAEPAVEKVAEPEPEAEVKTHIVDEL